MLLHSFNFHITIIWRSTCHFSHLRCFRLNMFPALWCQSPPLGMSFHILHPTFFFCNKSTEPSEFLSEPSEFLHQKKGRLPGFFLVDHQHPDLPFVHYIVGTNPSSCQQIMWQSVTPGEPNILGERTEDEGWGPSCLGSFCGNIFPPGRSPQNFPTVLLESKAGRPSIRQDLE